ncbi:MAG: molybdenum cofactor guanylyltransferase [Deltaproteobacteria bacterium]|nr:molybdenum cofactor guanylyltransferase [Deltaproteobacteria bacterium]MBW2395297.1 molybdenum cofactor guanylyltransferase [Deltaproteobacteria bacterium]
MSEPGADRFADVTGAVLLGGESTRMGQDKAHLDAGGVAAATRIARLLDGFCAEVLLVGGTPPADAPGRVVVDPDGPPSALRGLLGALAAARTEKVLVLATDYLAVTPEFLLGVLAFPEADVVVPRNEKHRHPLCALYRREPARAAAASALAEGKLALGSLLDALEPSWLEGAHLSRLDASGTALANVNTPEELAALREAWARTEGSAA